MKLAYVALGANLGDPIATVRSALEALTALPGHHLKAVSSLYRTAPLGLLGQPDFINAVAAVETPLAPDDLLSALFIIEARFGRRRGVRNAPRTLDLDLLLHGDAHSENPRLTLPHPRMHERAFVLAPLAEIAPALCLFGHGPITLLLEACADQGIERLATSAVAA